MPLERDEDIHALLAETRTIAMIGASDRPDRPSYGVMAYLQSRGYRVLPVNPQITGEHVHGEYVRRELSQIGEPIDMNCPLPNIVWARKLNPVSPSEPS